MVAAPPSVPAVPVEGYRAGGGESGVVLDRSGTELAVLGGGSGRQPGSTFKPVVLAANFEAGFGAGA